jgi:hypothetical protein
MASSGQQRATDDDLLGGFAEAGPGQRDLRGFFTATIAASLYTFDLAFHLGAYQVIFYQDQQHLYVLTVALLFAILVVRRQIRVHTWVLILFAPMFIHVVYRAATPVKHPYGTLGVIDDVLSGLNLIAIPVILWVTARLLAPHYFTLPSRRLKIAVLAAATIAGLIGYLIGTYNYRFLNCEDFTVAGSHPPANCKHGHSIGLTPTLAEWPLLGQQAT